MADLQAEYDSHASHDRLGKVRVHDWETSHQFLITPEEARHLARQLIRAAALAETDAATVESMIDGPSTPEKDEEAKR
jgi:hypothetical protein